jgi:hypothetical protein
VSRIVETWYNKGNVIFVRGENAYAKKSINRPVTGASPE